jgi:hypothetical protein
LELYDSYQFKIMECDQQAEKALAAFELRVPAPDLSRLRSADKRQEAVQRHHLEQMTGADLTKLPGLDLLTVQRILSEIGLDMSRWPSEKHFCAWLNVAPNNRISGGKILSSKPRKNANRAAAALRLAAQGAMQSKTAISTFIRRIKIASWSADGNQRRGPQTRPLALSHAQVRQGLRRNRTAYEKLFKERTLRNLQRKAHELGFDVTPMAFTALVS